jgi:glyoxalase superfamily protein
MRNWRRFTPALLTGTRLWTHQDGAAVDAGGVVLVMQRIEDYQPPAWPGTSIVHLELNGDVQIGELERRAVALAARPAPVQPDPRWRMLLDPVGHPFCITPLTPYGGRPHPDRRRARFSRPRPRPSVASMTKTTARRWACAAAAAGVIGNGTLAVGHRGSRLPVRHRARLAWPAS